MKRASDPSEVSVFRTDRFFRGDGHWYFATREEVDFGPYKDRNYAEQAVRRYIDTQRTMLRIRVRDPVLNPDNTFDEHGIAGIAKEIRTWSDREVGEIRADEQRLDADDDAT